MCWGGRKKEWTKTARPQITTAAAGGGAEDPRGHDVAGVDEQRVDVGTGADNDVGDDVEGESLSDEGAGGGAAGVPNVDGPGGAAGGGADDEGPVGACAENNGGVADQQRRVRRR